MMEVMITSREKFATFDKTGIPWSNIIAFVGHSPPRDSGLYGLIHAKGTSCMAGTSRNIDRQFIDQHITRIESLSKAYHGLIDKGIDLIETDIPREVGQLIYGKGIPVVGSQ
jgi:glycerophosphoryl diester phosphodiesterase